MHVYNKEGALMYFKTDAVVLKKTKLSDSDLILTLFTRKSGKVTVVSKGARNSKSKLSAASHPFVFGEYNITTSDKWNYLNSVDINDSFYHLREDLTKLSYASYLLELTNHAVSENASNIRLFELLVEVLNLMNRGDENYDLLKIAYEYKLMNILGYRMNMKQCVHCGKIDIKKFYINPTEGGLMCEECYNKVEKSFYVGKTLPKVLEYLVERDIRIIYKTKINESYIKRLDELVRPYIFHFLDRRAFKSLEFLDTINSM